MVGANQLSLFVPEESVWVPWPSGELLGFDLEIVHGCIVDRLDVVDRPGVLAKIATIFGESKIGISSVIQPEGHEGKSAPLGKVLG